jgi:uncharacterized membrane protein YkoI
MRISRAVELLVFVGLAITLPVLAHEKRIKRGDLPPAVEKRIAEQSKGSQVKGFSEERENGQTLYEVEMMVDGHSKDVLMSADGVVVEVEEQASLNTLNLAVQRGLRTKAGKGKIVKVESLTKRGTVVAYEAQIISDGKKSEIQVGPNGQPLDHEE